MARNGHWYFLGLELAGTGLAHGTASSANLLEDHLVQSGERVTEFCAKSVRVHGIKFLENQCLVLKCEGIKESCRNMSSSWAEQH